MSISSFDADIAGLASGAFDVATEGPVVDGVAPLVEGGGLDVGGAVEGGGFL